MSNRNHLNYQGTRYDLKHLKDFTFDLIQPAADKKPERKYNIKARFSWHCFTRSPETDDTGIMTNADGEQRCFCLDRYKHSHRLPDIITDLANRYCQTTGHGNFITVEIIEEDGTKQDYEIYFNVRKPASGKHLELFVETAFVRTIPELYKTKKKKIRFSTIIYNVKNGRPIRQ